MRIFGGAPCASSSHSTGTAISSPSRSRVGDVGEHDVRQRAGLMQLLAAALDAAFVGELAQHLLEPRAVGILEAEGAGDLARADLAGLLADEGAADRLWRGGRLRTFHNRFREQTSLAQVR